MADDPQFDSVSGLAGVVLVAAVIEELMDNGRLGNAGKTRIPDDTIHQLDRLDSPQAEAAADLVVTTFGLNRARRLRSEAPMRPRMRLAVWLGVVAGCLAVWWLIFVIFAGQVRP